MEPQMARKSSTSMWERMKGAVKTCAARFAASTTSVAAPCSIGSGTSTAITAINALQSAARTAC
eukprot:680408-Rhodomonas_salina.1